MDITKFQKETYVFMVDSSSRSRDAFPQSNTYSVEFNAPFLNVCALEVLRAHVPRSEYNIDEANNVLEYTLDDNQFVYRLTIEPGDYSLPRLISYLNERLLGGMTIAPLTTPYNVSNKIYFQRNRQFSILPSRFREALGLSSQQKAHSESMGGLVLEPAVDTTRDTLGDTIDVTGGKSVAQTFESTATGRLKEIRFMYVRNDEGEDSRGDTQATVTVRNAQGDAIDQGLWLPGVTDAVSFDGTTSIDSGQSYTVDVSVASGTVKFSTVVGSTMPSAAIDPSEPSQPSGPLGMSVQIDIEPHALVSDSLVDLTGYNDVVFIRCKEIEQVVFRERFGETNIHSGMGYVKFDTLSNNTSNLDYFQPFPPRELSLPLARLKRISFALETREGMLYNTRGLDHQIVCRITYYKAPSK
jgi:hypothetical protein